MASKPIKLVDDDNIENGPDGANKQEPQKQQEEEETTPLLLDLLGFSSSHVYLRYFFWCLILPFKFFGGRIYLHWSLALLCVVMFWSVNYVRPIWLYIVLGIVMLLVTVLSVFWHMFGHVVAYYFIYKRKMRVLALHLYGGYTFVREGVPDVRGSQAIIAVMGPVFSFILAAIFAGPYVYYRNTDKIFWVFGAGWFFYICFIFNIGMGLLNLAPVYPWSGGIIVRSIMRIFLEEKKAVLYSTVVSVVFTVALFLYAMITKDYWLFSLMTYFVFTILYQIRVAKKQPPQQQQQQQQQPPQPQQKQQMQQFPPQQPHQPQKQQTQQAVVNNDDVFVDVGEPRKPEKKGLLSFFD